MNDVTRIASGSRIVMGYSGKNKTLEDDFQITRWLGSKTSTWLLFEDGYSL